MVTRYDAGIKFENRPTHFHSTTDQTNTNGLSIGTVNYQEIQYTKGR
jgi:hypothetical protein